MPEPTLPLSAPVLSLLRRNLGRVIGPIEVVESFAEAVTESRSSDWQNLGAQGLWVIGRAINGDLWAIDVKDKERVVVLSHELILPGEVDDPREAMCVVAENLSDALEEARSNTLPIDYFSATEGEALEEPDSKLSYAPGGLDAGLAVPASRQGDVLEALFGAGTAVKWEVLEEIFFELETSERAVLAARYGLFGGSTATVEEAAKSLGLTADMVRDEEKKGLRWLKRLAARPKT